MVEQLTLNQLVLGSSPSRGTFPFMAWVYLLQGASGRFYLGSTDDLQRRFAQHQAGLTPSTKRLGLPLVLVAFRVFSS
jgi:predicted GIY-YIG superfamily endonuclease